MSEEKTEASAAKCKRVPIAKLTSGAGKDLVQVFNNYWWITDHNDNALFFRSRNPQCNANQKVAESIRDRLYPGYEVRLLPIALIPIKVTDGEFDYAEHE